MSHAGTLSVFGILHSAFCIDGPSAALEQINGPSTVAESVERKVEVVGGAQPDVTPRRSLGSSNVSMTFAQATADEYQRQSVWSVNVSVTHTAAVSDHRVVEQRAVAVGRRTQLFDELRKELDVKQVDLRVRGDLFRIASVMRYVVMAGRDSKLRVCVCAEVARHHEREDATQVGFVRHRRKVEHQGPMVTVRLWNANR